MCRNGETKRHSPSDLMDVSMLRRVLLRLDPKSDKGKVLRFGEASLESSMRRQGFLRGAVTCLSPVLIAPCNERVRFSSSLRISTPVQPVSHLTSHPHYGSRTSTAPLSKQRART